MDRQERLPPCRSGKFSTPRPLTPSKQWPPATPQCWWDRRRPRIHPAVFSGAQGMPGVELHATELANRLEDRSLHWIPAPRGWNYVMRGSFSWQASQHRGKSGPYLVSACSQPGAACNRRSWTDFVGRPLAPLLARQPPGANGFLQR